MPPTPKTILRRKLAHATRLEWGHVMSVYSAWGVRCVALMFTGKVFISTPEEHTGPAYTQMKLQHRSRAPGHTPLIA